MPSLHDAGFCGIRGRDLEDDCEVDRVWQSPPVQQSGHRANINHMSERPFRVLGLQQIAIGGLDKGGLTGLWTGLLGVDKVGDYVSESENVDEDILQLGSGVHAVEIDLMQPLDPERSPKVHVPTLNHVGLWIDDLPACVDWLTGQGLRFTPGGIRKGAGGHDVCFIHPKGNDDTPKSGEGVLIELVQAPPEVIAELSP
jgi:lactoylglutathione lyase